MQGNTLPTPPASSSLSSADVFKNSKDERAPLADPGTLELRDFGASYVQSVHWEAILAKIRGLKEDLVIDSKAPDGSHLFYGPNRHANREEVLAAVPPRPVADRLMALNFDSYIVTQCQYIQAFFPLRGTDCVL